MSCLCWDADSETEEEATEYDTGDPAWAASQCADYCYVNSGGEWCEYTINVKCQDGVIRTYRCEPEASVSFHPSLINASV